MVETLTGFWDHQKKSKMFAFAVSIMANLVWHAAGYAYSFLG